MPEVPLTSTVNCSSLIELLRWRALDQSDRRAYTFLVDDGTDEISLTYGELDRRARAVGALLQSAVPRPWTRGAPVRCGGMAGERALLLYPSGLEYIVAFFGCLYAGMIAVPSYPPRLDQPGPLYHAVQYGTRLQAIVADAQPVVALTTASILSTIERWSAHTMGLEAPKWLATDNLSSDLAEEWRDPEVESDALALLQYTSGSTATPRGVMVSHGNLLHNSDLIRQCFEHTPDSQIVFWLPLYHDMGLIGGMLQSLYCGVPGILMSPLAFLQRPLRWLQAISRYRATTSGAPNFAYDLCVHKIAPAQRATLDLSSWETAFNGAEPVRHGTLEQFTAAFEPCGFRREAFYPCYGLAEATLIVSGGLKASPPVVRPVQGTALEGNRVIAISEDEDARTLVGCGQTLQDQKIVIVDAESLTLCPPDWIGEIWVSGPSVAQGYWNRPDEAEHTFQAYLVDTGEGPFLRTGDLGFLKDDELFITGRLKDLIIIDGRNHYPQDIELTVEQSHPALRSGCCAAFSIEVENRERLVVVAEVRRRYQSAHSQEDTEPDLASEHHPSLNVQNVVKAIRRAVAEQHGVQVYAVSLLKSRRIPKTSSGKIQRHACRSGYLTGSLDVWSA